MTMSNKPPESRRELCDLLESWLEADEGEPLPPGVRHLFAICIEGLKALDHGEVPEIFRPVVARRRGVRPARIRELEIWALRHEAALRRHADLSAEDARSKIAKAYGRSNDALKIWSKNLKAEAALSKDLGTELATTLMMDKLEDMAHRQMGRTRPTEESIIKQAKEHGSQYRILRKQPKTKK